MLHASRVGAQVELLAISVSSGQRQDFNPDITHSALVRHRAEPRRGGAGLWQFRSYPELRNAGTRSPPSMYLIDAHSLIFQVFHAIPQMSSPSGLPTNALYGFT